jgi:antitoxin (DNA-binding transcriptional repressor) of toxin-antitoxin stability system
MGICCTIKTYAVVGARMTMKTYPLSEARADLSKLVDRALAGEPQRVTRYGKEAARTRAAPTLGTLLAQHARAGTFGDSETDRPWLERPLGQDVE